MCSSKMKLQERRSSSSVEVVQPNRRPLLERCNSIPPLTNNNSNNNNVSRTLNKSKSFKGNMIMSTTSTSSSSIPGSIAAARREQVAIVQEQRKMRIAHYGRTTSTPSNSHPQQQQDHHKRCTFITPNSDPIYVAYHDQEWGVPVHDDELLFELLVLTGAQVGSDWASVLRRREEYRDAFSRFQVEIVSKYSEKKMSSISGEYGIELSLVRGVVDNAKRIVEIKKELGSLDKYLWGFVNHRPMVTGHKWCHKIPVKTSKSEGISKDMVRRGFRLVGPTVIHSFMQAAGLINDHLITCPRHSQLQSLSQSLSQSQSPTTSN